jgi:hypothetical protein
MGWQVCGPGAVEYGIRTFIIIEMWAWVGGTVHTHVIASSATLECEITFLLPGQPWVRTKQVLNDLIFVFFHAFASCAILFFNTRLIAADRDAQERQKITSRAPNQPVSPMGADQHHARCDWTKTERSRE